MSVYWSPAMLASFGGVIHALSRELISQEKRV